MKNAVIAALLIGVLMGTTGCLGVTEGRPVPPAAGAPAPAPTPTQPEILMGEAQVTAEMKAWAAGLRNQAGAFRTTLGDWDTYVVSMGEQRSGGYGVEVVQAGFSGGKEWVVQVRYRTPAPGTITTMALTYPQTMFAVPKGTPVKIQAVKETGDPQTLTIKQK